jgi:hypothetical protein
MGNASCRRAGRFSAAVQDVRQKMLEKKEQRGKSRVSK